jgi:hypothetical protein
MGELYFRPLIVDEFLPGAYPLFTVQSVPASGEKWHQNTLNETRSASGVLREYASLRNDFYDYSQEGSSMLL